jgi:hypothetical protein
MGDVLEFPSQHQQGLAFLEREVRQLLTARGADPTLVDFAARQLVDSYSELSEAEQYRFSVRLPAALSAAGRASLEQQITLGLEGIRRENHALLVKLVARLVLAEMRLFQLQRTDDSD